MATELDSFFIKIGAMTKEFDREYNRVEKQVKDATYKFAFSINVDPRSLEQLNKEMERLRDRAQELRGDLLTIKPTIENPNAVRDLEHELAKVEHQLRLVEDTAEGVRRKFKQWGDLGRDLTLKVTLPIMVGFGLATRAVSEFEREMRNVNSIARMSEEGLRKTTDEVKKLAVELGKMPTDLAKGLYDIASSGFSGEAGKTVLEAAATGAKAGLATTQDAAKGITTVLNAYGMGAEKAARINDVMFKAVDIGVVEYSELANSMGAVLATASAAGVPFEQVAAGFATMTKGGIDAAETATSLNRVILAFLNPSKQLAKALEESGYASGIALLQTQGLASAVEYLQQVTGGEADALAQMGLDARALKAALSLAREEGRVFSADLEAMYNATGAASAALAEQTKAFSAQWEQTKASATVFAISIGESLLPVLKLGASLLTSMTEALAQMPPSLRSVVVLVAALAAGMGPLLMRISKGRDIALAARAGWLKLGAAMKWLAAHPVVLVIAGVTALTLAIVKLVDVLHTSTDDMIRDTERSIENAKAMEQQAQKTQRLVSEYEELSKKANRTNVEQAKMNLLLVEIKGIMPELVKDGNLVADAYDRISESAKKMSAELKQLQIRKLALEEHKLREEIAAGESRERKWAAWRDTSWTAIERKYAERKRYEAELYVYTKRQELALKQQERRELTHADRKREFQQELNNSIAKEKAHKADVAAAEAEAWEIAKRGADELGKLEMERQEALKESAGPLHTEQINRNYDDLITRKQKELAQKQADIRRRINERELKAQAEYEAISLRLSGRTAEAEKAQAKAQLDAELRNYEQLRQKGESVDSSIRNAKAKYQQAITEIEKRESDRRLKIAQAEGDAKRQIVIDQLRAAGRDHDARYASILDTYAKDIQNIDNQGLTPEQSKPLKDSAWWRMAADVRKLNEQVAREEEDARRESLTKSLRADRERETSASNSYRLLIDMAVSYYDRLNGWINGEAQMRIDQIERWRLAQRKAIEDSIADEKLKAEALEAIDSDAAMQISDIEREEYGRRLHQAQDFLERMRQAVSFSGIESLWKRTVESGIRQSFNLPQMNPSFAGPSFAVSGGMGLDRVSQLLQEANRLHQASERRLRDIDRKLEAN